MKLTSWLTKCYSQWILFGLVLLFVVLCMVAVHEIGVLQGRSRVRMDACVWNCDRISMDVEPSEYIECLETCEAWRCE